MGREVWDSVLGVLGVLGVCVFEREVEIMLLKEFIAMCFPHCDVEELCRTATNHSLRDIGWEPRCRVWR